MRVDSFQYFEQKGIVQLFCLIFPTINFVVKKKVVRERRRVTNGGYHDPNTQSVNKSLFLQRPTLEDCEGFHRQATHIAETLLIEEQMTLD